MVRVLGIIAAVVILAAAIAAVVGFGRITSFDVEQVTDDLHVLYGQGGNVAVLGTERGAVVVDTMIFRIQGDQIRELAEDLGRGPVQAVVNTHYHWDHTHGNPGFPVGTRIVATERTRRYLQHFDADYWEGEAEGTLPNQTLEREERLDIGGKTIRLLHPGRGHTGGDLVVFFVEDRAVHLGDLFFNGRYPNIDLEAGGSVREWGATLDRVLELGFDRVIPGHGPVTDRAGLEAFQLFIRELWQVAERAAQEGKSLEETLQTAGLRADAGYQVIGIPFLLRLDRKFVIRRAWEEATGAVRPVALAPAPGGA
jgi:glyoxylase-like metal-dependent hydrolase (beta-lactamase superfamily II)